MGKERQRVVITRMMQLAVLLHQTKRGLTVQELTDKLEYGRNTVYRDLKSLQFAGIGLTKETVVGETRYSLANWPIPAVAPTQLELAALCLARQALGAFEGTEAVRQLDQLLERWGKLPKKQLSLKYHRKNPQPGSVVGTIDRAIAKHQRLEIAYQGTSDNRAKPRKIDPIELRASGEQLYLFAYDVVRQDYRVFKTTRMANAQLLPETAIDHSQVDVDARFTRAVKAWTAQAPTKVVVRLSSEKARFADEYPLVADQVTTVMPDGCIEIAAEVNGIIEALNWVLGWGAHAEAISPPELRVLAAEQLRNAAQKYAGTTRNDNDLPMDETGISVVAAKERTESDTPKQGVSRELRRRRNRVAG